MKLKRRGAGYSLRQKDVLLKRKLPVADAISRFGPLLARLRPVVAWVKRWLFLILLGLFLGWVLLMGELRVVALGEVDAKVIRVAAAFPAQVTSVFATCNDDVAAGAPLAQVRNEIMVQQYRTEYARVDAELNELRNSYNARLRAAEETVNAAKHEHEAAVKIRDNVTTLRATMEPLWKGRQVTLTEWLDIDNNWVKAVSAEASSEANWRSKTADAERTRLELQDQIAGLQGRLTELGRLLTLSGEEKLSSQVSGVVTVCERKPGEVVAAGETIMEVQADDTPSVIAYIAAADMGRIRQGMPALVFLSTQQEPLHAVVAALPVQVGRLPGKLKRYFWQGQEWQQYAPVRLIFPEKNTAVARLRYNERVDVLFDMHPSLGIPLSILNVF